MGVGCRDDGRDDGWGVGDSEVRGEESNGLDTGRYGWALWGWMEGAGDNEEEAIEVDCCRRFDVLQAGVLLPLVHPYTT